MGANNRPTQQDLEELEAKLDSGELSAEAVMAQLVSWMRKHSDLPGARELYQRASQEAYGARSSSLSHSHPPPDVDGE